MSHKTDIVSHCADEHNEKDWAFILNGATVIQACSIGSSIPYIFFTTFYILKFDISG